MLSVIFRAQYLVSYPALSFLTFGFLDLKKRIKEILTRRRQNKVKKYSSFVLIIFQISDVRTGVCAYMDAKKIKIETRPFYRKKIKILKNMTVKPRLLW